MRNARKGREALNSPCRVAREGDARTPRYAYAYTGSRRVRTSHRGKLLRSDSMVALAQAAAESLEKSPETLGARGNAGPRCTRTAARGRPAYAAARCLRLRALVRGTRHPCACCIQDPEKVRRRAGALRRAHAPETPGRARRYCDGELGLQLPAVACGNAPTHAAAAE